MQSFPYENYFYLHANFDHFHVNKNNFSIKGFALGLAFNRDERRVGNGLFDMTYLNPR